MTRRGQASAAVECLRIETRLSDNIDDAVLYCACGSFRIFPGEDTGTVISAGSVLRMSDLTSGVRMFPEQLGSVLISVCISLQVKKRNS
jgi:hypothetical protein